MKQYTQDQIHEVAKAFKDHEIIAIPTDTVYGVGVILSVVVDVTDVVEQDIRDGDNYYSLSVFSVQDYSLVCGIIQNLHAPEVRKDLVLKRTQDVIMENMKVVQQIAFLLGENASYTEAMLNSIVESHQDGDKKDNEQKTFEL